MLANTQEMRDQLLKDKHTILEGYIPEELFEEQFLKKSNTGSVFDNVKAYSKGWWKAERNDEYYFFHLKKNLKDRDNYADRTFKKFLKGCHVFDVALKANTLVFKKVGEKVEDTLIDFCSKYSLSANKCTDTSDVVKNIDRQERCIKYFKNNKELKEIAIQRYFADDFLQRYLKKTVNIDFLTYSNNEELSIIEVKYKYEDLDGYFGINTGQLMMFEFLSKKGIKIHHVILYNCLKKSCCIFDFLKEKIEKKWLYKMLENGNFSKETRLAKKETSCCGNKAQPFKEFSKTSTNFIGELEIKQGMLIKL